MIKGVHLLATLHPQFRPYVEEALSWMDYYGVNPVVTECYRSPARQNELYAQGRTRPGRIVTNARAGESAHNYGLAVDVMAGAGYNSPQQKLIPQIFQALGFKTISWDLPHGEHPLWKEARR